SNRADSQSVGTLRRLCEVRLGGYARVRQCRRARLCGDISVAIPWDGRGRRRFFVYDDKIYQGSGGGSGMGVWTRPDARKVQFRLYYEVNYQVFTDGILHQSELPEDAVTL